MTDGRRGGRPFPFSARIFWRGRGNQALFLVE